MVRACRLLLLAHERALTGRRYAGTPVRATLLARADWLAQACARARTAGRGDDDGDDAYANPRRHSNARVLAGSRVVCVCLRCVLWCAV